MRFRLKNTEFFAKIKHFAELIQIDSSFGIKSDLKSAYRTDMSA